MGQYLLGTRAGLLGTRAGLSTLPSVFKNEGILFFWFLKKGGECYSLGFEKGAMTFSGLKNSRQHRFARKFNGVKTPGCRKVGHRLFSVFEKGEDGQGLICFLKRVGKNIFWFLKNEGKDLFETEKLQKPCTGTP